MIPATPDAACSHLEVRAGRVSSVIVTRVPTEWAERFLEWQRGITQAAEAFPGYQATDAYPPSDSSKPEWVVVIHFDDTASLQGWLDSSVRTEWTAKLPAGMADFRLKTLAGGFGPWFAGLVDSDGLPPPHWKMALAVLLGLYPTVMLLSILVLPPPDRLGMAVTMLIGNILGVCLLEWAVMPGLKRVLDPWLRASGEQGRTLSVVGLLLILGVLGTLTLLFRQFAG